MIYFTADTHFFDFSIVKSCVRPFSTIEEMHIKLIENWNSTVMENDEIYILGDFMYGRDGIEANNILKILNGKKYMIAGNHDKFLDDKLFDTSHFEWIKDYYVLDYQNIKIVMCHYPVYEFDELFKNENFKTSIHLYSHIHNRTPDPEQIEKLKLLGKRAVNVGVDVNNFFPVSIDTVI